MWCRRSQHPAFLCTRPPRRPPHPTHDLTRWTSVAWAGGAGASLASRRCSRLAPSLATWSFHRPPPRPSSCSEVGPKTAPPASPCGVEPRPQAEMLRMLGSYSGRHCALFCLRGAPSSWKCQVRLARLAHRAVPEAFGKRGTPASRIENRQTPGLYLKVVPPDSATAHTTTKEGTRGPEHKTD